MRLAGLELALLVLPLAFAAKTKRRFSSKAQFTDALSLLSKLNTNPAALDEALTASHVSLSQGGASSGTRTAVGAAGGDEAAFGVLSGLSGGEGATAGSDDAADAVSDSIRDLFDLGDAKPAGTHTAAVTVSPSKAKVLNAPSAKVPQAPAAKVPTPPPASSDPKVGTKLAVVRPVSKAAKPLRRPAPVAKKVEHTPPPSPKQPSATVAHPSTAKKQQATSAQKQKLVASASPPKFLAHEAHRPSEPSPAMHHSQPSSSQVEQIASAPTKLSTLEAEVSALRAKLANSPVAVVKPEKPAVLPSPHHPTDPQSSAAPLPQKHATPASTHHPTVAQSAEAPVPDKTDHDARPLSATQTAMHPPAAAGPSIDEMLKWHVGHSDNRIGVGVAPVSVVAAAPERPPYSDQAATNVVTVKTVPISSVAQESIITAPSPVSLFGSVGHWFHRVLFGADPPRAPLPTIPPPHDPNEGRPAFSPQNIEWTAESAVLDGLGDVAIGDDFAQKEAEDVAHIDHVRRADRALRIEAQTPQKPSMAAPANFVHQAGSTHISDFWGTLADEDADIEHALAANGDDLSEYQRLKSLQDARIQESVGEITGHSGSHMAMERKAFRTVASSAA